MRIAVIDLGTNTCNLLIAEIRGEDFEILHQSKELVKLGDGDIKDNRISEAAIQRTVAALQTHRGIADDYHVDLVRVIATSAVRSAQNKIQFLETLGDKTGWLVRVVNGETEAELIFKGVQLAMKNSSDPALILDIGGGSNEIILAELGKMLWKESQPAGMARVINRFSLSDPITETEISLLQNYFAEMHCEAFKNAHSKKINTLIGCSGAFDTIADLVDEVEPGEKQRTCQNISVEDFYAVYQRLVSSSRNERLQMKGVDRVRVDLIVPAVILIEKIISELGIQTIYQTDFALREGVLSELMKVN